MGRLRMKPLVLCSDGVWRSPSYADTGMNKGYPFYAAWMRMRSRCNNPNRDNYSYYGDRGIKVCAEWSSFNQFKKDMFLTWERGLCLDRIDPNLDYCK